MGREAQPLIEAGRLKILEDCQQLFATWLHSECNVRVHCRTQETPDARRAHVHPDHAILWVGSAGARRRIATKIGVSARAGTLLAARVLEVATPPVRMAQWRAERRD